MAPRKPFFLDEFGPFVGLDEIADITARRLDRMKRDADRSFSGTAIVRGPATASDVTSTFRVSNGHAAAPSSQGVIPNRAERRSARFVRVKKENR